MSKQDENFKQLIAHKADKNRPFNQSKTVKGKASFSKPTSQTTGGTYHNRGNR